MNAPTPSDEPFSDFWDDAKVADQPEDAALREQLALMIGCCPECGSKLTHACSGLLHGELLQLLQLFHAHEQEKVQAAYSDCYSILYEEFPTGDVSAWDALQAIQRIQKRIKAKSVSIEQPPAADTTKQGEGESDE